MDNPSKELRTQAIDPRLEEDLRMLVRLAIREDLDRGMDLTTVALVPAEHRGRARLVARQPVVACGVDLIAIILEECDAKVAVEPHRCDGDRFQAGDCLAVLSGDARDLLTCERTVLNFLGPLCGIASLADRFQQKIAHTSARLLDTRKTTPGWRRLEKYAVRCGGAWTHRMGLFDAVLIKDNHLASRASKTGQLLDPAQAVEEARRFLDQSQPADTRSGIWIEIEIDSLEQLPSALQARPDYVLLDNMNTNQLREAVLIRNRMAPQVLLEASGGVRLETVAAIAETGVDRISVGALTHSALNLDLGLDWTWGEGE
ncbi:MAG: carboxylating nicotinate-nucleotide diphosphorylase [Pirellulaceae bacterium]